MVRAKSDNQIFNKKLSNIKLLACDFDGVFTDGTVYVSQEGNESVRCSRRDGMGVLLLQRNGIEVVVVSYEANPVVTRRCEKMNIKCHQKVQSGEGKVDILKRVVAEKKLLPEQVAFVGDDINDLPALKYAGVAMTVADGHPNVKKHTDYVTEAYGGQHAIREIAELILKSQNKRIEII